MKLALLSVEQKKTPGLDDLTAEYSKKISGFVPFEHVTVKTSKFAREDRLKKLEGESAELLKKIDPGDYVILLDERGKEGSSLDFSKRLVHAFESGKRRVVFVVGGAYGMSDALKARGQEVWTLSRLTLAHPVAMAVLLEQLFRGLTIWKGVPYHNE